MFPRLNMSFYPIRNYFYDDFACAKMKKIYLHIVFSISYANSTSECLSHSCELWFNDKFLDQIKCKKYCMFRVSCIAIQDSNEFQDVQRISYTDWFRMFLLWNLFSYFYGKISIHAPLHDVLALIPYHVLYFVSSIICLI